MNRGLTLGKRRSVQVYGTYIHTYIHKLTMHDFSIESTRETEMPCEHGKTEPQRFLDSVLSCHKKIIGCPSCTAQDTALF